MSVFRHDLVRTTRRGRAALLRTAYALALLAALGGLFVRWFPGGLAPDRLFADSRLAPRATRPFAREFPPPRRPGRLRRLFRRPLLPRPVPARVPPPAALRPGRGGGGAAGGPARLPARPPPVRGGDRRRQVRRPLADRGRPPAHRPAGPG